ncbi:melanization protease 1-like isoform X1 [Neodiprion pinetum]|uniref:melanization protease 1-like isoform X1 n=1 Tax=Neodiprion pinetum TaxID=441929 RepID=UPI001EDCDEF4|nr:melanization protease 1-like isoform X1 [Neodiprion pinetum]
MALCSYPHLYSCCRYFRQSNRVSIIFYTCSSQNVTTEDHSSTELLSPDCGRNLGQPLRDGSKTELSEFPWLVLVEFIGPNGQVTITCNGVLISKRYVMTAGYCARRTEAPSSTTRNQMTVRLGEYDLVKKKDCVQTMNGSESCSDDPTRINIEEVTVHEDYSPNLPEQWADIALLRLSQDVTFTKYIQPVCLPSKSATADEGEFYVVGWGRTKGSKENPNPEKLKFKLPTVDFERCLSLFPIVREGQFCAGGAPADNFCVGHGGAPLMNLEKTNDGDTRWTVSGIVLFGRTNCIGNDSPEVYTKVAHYVPWILSKIRA